MKLKKWQNASTEDRKRKKKVHSLPNKNQDRSELILIEIQSFQIEKAPNGGPYQDTSCARIKLKKQWPPYGADVV